jgi:hypothetical protein
MREPPYLAGTEHVAYLADGGKRDPDRSLPCFSKGRVVFSLTS